MKTAWTTHVVEAADGEMAIELPADLLAQMGWDASTELWWDIDEDGNVFLKKEKEDDESSK